MQLSASDLPAGIPLTWTLFMRGGVEVAQLSSVSGPGVASLAVDDWVFPEVMLTDQELEAGEEFEVFEFTFTVEGGGRSQDSADAVTYSDTLNTQLSIKLNDDDVFSPQAMPYVVHTLVGSRKGVTQTVDGQDGFVIETGLPPGGATVVVEDLEAVRAS